MNKHSEQLCFLPCGDSTDPMFYDNHSFVPENDYSEHITARVILGPQDNYFTAKGIDTFLSSTYTVSDKSDRMGIRLDGQPIENINGVDIISDGIVTGSIQIPASGTPIIMMADRQTTGGYAKIATVISVDLKKIAQAKEIGLSYAQEVFADRAYEDDGTLVARTKPGAMITDEDEAVSRVIRMFKEHRVKTVTGNEIEIVPDSVCVHGDSKHALQFVKKNQIGAFGRGNLHRSIWRYWEIVRIPQFPVCISVSSIFFTSLSKSDSIG